MFDCFFTQRFRASIRLQTNRKYEKNGVDRRHVVRRAGRSSHAFAEAGHATKLPHRPIVQSRTAPLVGQYRAAPVPADGRGRVHAHDRCYPRRLLSKVRVSIRDVQQQVCRHAFDV